MYTDIKNTSQMDLISKSLNKVCIITEWSVDLPDPDRVMRICSNEQISDCMGKLLLQLGISSRLIAIFDKNGSQLQHS